MTNGREKNMKKTRKIILTSLVFAITLVAFTDLIQVQGWDLIGEWDTGRRDCYYCRGTYRHEGRIYGEVNHREDCCYISRIIVDYEYTCECNVDARSYLYCRVLDGGSYWLFTDTKPAYNEQGSRTFDVYKTAWRYNYVFIDVTWFILYYGYPYHREIWGYDSIYY